MNKKWSKVLYYTLILATVILVLYGYFSFVAHYSGRYPDLYLLEEPLMSVNGFTALAEYPIRLLCFALYGFLTARIIVRSKPGVFKPKGNCLCAVCGFLIGVIIGIISLLPSNIITVIITITFEAICNIDGTSSILRPTYALEYNLTSMFLAILSYVIITEITIKKLNKKLSEQSKD